ncbi:MAG: hypothetical protein RIC55_12415 [Pirellulaceae bacterium]
MSRRDAYLQKLEAQLDQWSAQLDQWEARARNSQADSKIAVERRLGELRERQEAAQAKLRELRSSSGEAWETLKDGAENVFADMRESVERAVAQIR